MDFRCIQLKWNTIAFAERQTKPKNSRSGIDVDTGPEAEGVIDGSVRIALITGIYASGVEEAVQEGVAT
jgi:hypothetical protein